VAAGTSVMGARRFGVRPLVLGLVALAVAAGAGYVAYSRLSAPATVAAPAGTPARVQRGNFVATVSATGQVIGTRQSKLTLPTGAGRITELPIRLGDPVKVDDVLARTDPTPLETKLSQAESSLRTAQVKLAQLKAGAKPEDVAAAEASVRSAQAKLSDVQAGTAQADLVQAQTAVESAAANVRSAQSKLEQLRQGAAAADVAAAEQAVQSAQTSLQKAEAALAVAQAGPKADDIRIAELAVEQAKTTLWSQQISRDATCSRGADSAACQSANAGIAGSELGVVKANEALAVLRRGADANAVAAAQADVASAKEGLRTAQLRLEQVKAGPSADEVQTAQTAIETAQANQRSAVARLDALRQGAKPADVEAARSAVLQAQQALETKKNPTTVHDIQLAEEVVKSAELAVKQARIDLEAAIVRAPFAGVVAAVAGTVGEQPAANTAVVTLVDPSALRVDVTVDESDIARVQRDQRAEITFDALEGGRFDGKVLGVAPTATVTQGVATYTVQVSIDNPSRPIPIGLTANVAIVTTEKSGVLLIPNRALKRQGREQVVDVLVDGKTETRPVQAGLSNDQVTEVTRGVAEGDTVLIPSTTAAQPRGFGGPGGGFGGPAIAIKPAVKGG
jgi:HlyD family secretion protein